MIAKWGLQKKLGHLTTCLSGLKTMIDKYCNNKDDFQKAFDTVMHTGIKIKLLENGIGHHFYNIIKSMYSQSKSCVRLNNTLTDFLVTMLE